MALYLVQHGKSLSKDVDPEKGLSEVGKKESNVIAGVARGYAVPVRIIRHSGKKRALETAMIFKDHLNPGHGIDMIEGIRPMDDVMAFAAGLDANENALIVGHLPFMERLVGYLIAGNPALLVFKFQNSGIVCLDKKEDAWFIRWALMPNIG